MSDSIETVTLVGPDGECVVNSNEVAALIATGEYSHPGGRAPVAPVPEKIPGKEELETMKIPQLRELAKAKGVSDFATLNRANLIVKLTELSR